MFFTDDGFDWETFLIPYDQAVSELRLKFNQFKAQYEKRGEYSPIHYVSARLKSIPSIIAKAKKYELSIDEIAYKLKDIVGIRLVTQFEEDVHLLAKLLRFRSDMRVVLQKNYFDTPKPSGYKSLHIIVEYTVNTVIGAQTVLCEIQLRTLAMDFWASIEHTLNYKYHNELPQELRERLFNASQGVIALDSEMGKIRDEITGNNYYTNNKYKLMSTVDDHIQRLSDSGFEALSSQYTSDFNQIRQEDNSIQLYLLSKELEKELKEHNIYVEGDQNQ